MSRARYFSKYLITTLLLVYSLAAETKRALRGEIKQEGSKRSDVAWAELIQRGRPVSKAAVMPDGTFELRGIESGDYELRVTTLYGATLGTEYVSIREFSDNLVIRLPEQNEAKPISGTISVKRLQ